MKKVLIAALVALVSISCGDTKKEATEVTKEVVVEKPAVAKEVEKSENTGKEVTLLLSSNDQMQYDKTILKVKEGARVVLTFKHTGTMPKKVMGHNFVLLKQGTDIPSFAQLAMQAADKEYIPESDAIIVHTKIIGGGESVTITFDAPAKGTYDYICSFPGHYSIMKGKFIVE
ncbi:MAG: azurin [Flavobacteriaceae bacterium]|nr:MAG: azurin [Flavobacteriaceae bacterium]